MAQIKITPENVDRAAATIAARGAKVTNRAVLEEIGGGSLSTIVPLVRDWQRKQDEILVSGGGDELSEAGRRIIQRAQADNDLLSERLKESRATNMDLHRRTQEAESRGLKRAGRIQRKLTEQINYARFLDGRLDTVSAELKDAKARIAELERQLAGRQDEEQIARTVEGQVFRWPEPSHIPGPSGMRMNPERITRLSEFIREELVYGEQLRLVADLVTEPEHLTQVAALMHESEFEDDG